MALGDFDSKQSSFDFGMSLLGDKEERDKRARKKQKKIRNVSYLLNTIGVADMFLVNKAAKKADLFKENLVAEKAEALTAVKLATDFNSNQLQKLQSQAGGTLDFDDPNQWKEGGLIYHAIKPKQGLNARNMLGIGQNQDIPTDKLQDYNDTVEELTKQSLESIKAEYKKFKPDLERSTELVNSQYEKLLKEGTRQIMSPRNTSSIRKLLAKFDIANDIGPELEKQEKFFGVEDIYFNKNLAEQHRNRLQTNKVAYDNYLTTIGERTTTSDEINLSRINTGTNSVITTQRSKHPAMYNALDSTVMQMTPSDSPAGQEGVTAFANSDQNKTLKELDAIDITTQAGVEQGLGILSVDPDSDATARFSEIWDQLDETERGRLYQGAKYFLGKSTEKYDIDGASADPSVIAQAWYDSYIALATPKGISQEGFKSREFDIDIMTIDDYLSLPENEAEADNVISTSKNEEFAENNPPSIITGDNGEQLISIPNNGQILTLPYDEVIENFKSALESAETNERRKTLIEDALNDLPIGIHPELQSIYDQSIIETETISPFTDEAVESGSVSVPRKGASEKGYDTITLEMDDEGNINQVRLPIAKKNQKISFADIPEGPIKEQIRNLSMQYVLAESFLPRGSESQPSIQEIQAFINGELNPEETMERGDMGFVEPEGSPYRYFNIEGTLTPDKILNASKTEMFIESKVDRDINPLSLLGSGFTPFVETAKSLTGQGGITFTNNGQKIINKIDLVGIGDLSDIRALFKDAFYDSKTQDYINSLPYKLYTE